MPDPDPMDIPEKRWQVVRRLLLLTPACFVLCYLLAWVQGAPTETGLLIAGVGAALCAAVAGAIYLFGSKAWMVLLAVKLALLLVIRR